MDALPTWTWEIDVRHGSVRSVAYTAGGGGGGGEGKERIDAMFLPAYAKLMVKVALQVGNAGDVARWLPVRPYEEGWEGVWEVGGGVGEGDGVGERVGEGDRDGKMERGMKVEVEVGR